MLHKVLFLWAVLPTLLALATASVSAAPTVAQFGNSHVTVILSPDPPVVGTNSVTVQIAGAPASALEHTTVRYATIMPSMNMEGPNGAAVRVAGRADEWRFDVNFGMAAPWVLRVQLSGGVSGTVNADVRVANAMNSMPGMAAGSSSGSMSGMNMSSDNAAPWRNGAFALLAVILVGGVILWRNRRPLTIALVVGAGLVVIGLAYAQSRYAPPSMDMASMSNVGGDAPVPVALATVGGDPSGREIQVPANVAPYLTQNIVARAPGLLTDLSAYTGDKLRAGEVIARLSEPELQSNAEAARAAADAAQIEAMHHAPNAALIAQNDLRVAQSDEAGARADVVAKSQQVAYWNSEVRREKQLLDQGAVSQREYQDESAQAAAAQSAYDAAREKVVAARAQAASAQMRTSDAQAEIEAAQAQAAQASAAAQAQSVTAGYTNVIVPDDAVVMKRLVDPGVYVQPGTPILQVAVIDRLRIQAQVAEQDLPGVKVGAPVDVTFDNGIRLHGRINSVSPVADQNTHTAIAEAILENPGRLLQPGGFVHAIIHASETQRRNTFTVPSTSVVGGETTAVWIDVDGTAHRVPVTVISDDGTTAQVSGDIHPGVRVVVTGAQGLEEAQPIAEAAQ